MRTINTKRNNKIIKFITNYKDDPDAVILASDKFDISPSVIYHVCKQNNISIPRMVGHRLDIEAHDVRGIHPCLNLGLGYN